MHYPPTLETSRLILRPFAISDSERVRELAGAKEVYDTTLLIPHPYKEGVAEKWISSHAQQFYCGDGVSLAVIKKDSSDLIGSIGLAAFQKHKRAELGYWIGTPYWGNGYCTEAAKEIIRYGFEVLGYHKISSRHMEFNPASGRVMEKAGMQKEGLLIDEVMKDGKFHTLIVYGLINSRAED